MATHLSMSLSPARRASSTTMSSPFNDVSFRSWFWLCNAWHIRYYWKWAVGSLATVSPSENTNWVSRQLLAVPLVNHKHMGCNVHCRDFRNDCHSIDEGCMINI